MSDARTRESGYGERLLRSWERLSSKPGGRWLFSRMVGRMAPYTGTIGATVLELRPGHALVQLRDRPRVRNHLRSVHAIALANLGELASGLAATAALPAGVRGIPNRITVDYLKKARGTLTATGVATIPTFDVEAVTEVHAVIRNAEGETVTKVTVQWKLSRA